MPSYKTHFPSTYLEKEDLRHPSGNGWIELRAVIATIASEKVGDDQKMVIYFQSMEKGMVGNRTNADTIADLYGEDLDDWIGREVVIYVDPAVMYAGKRVGGLRLKAPQAKQAQPVTRGPGTIAKGQPSYKATSGPPDDETPPIEAYER